MNFDNTSTPWTLADAQALYAIEHWGAGYYGLNAQGRVCVKPRADHPAVLDLHEIAESIVASGLSMPVLVRFTDILADRVRALQQGFDRARAAHDYQGRYTPVYPIKVNQQGHVVEGILKGGRVGLEAGSKAELLAILGLSRHGLIVCNGYKDRAYIRLALIGQRLGLNVFIVIEKPSELELLLEEAAQLGVTPQLGVRIRLASISAGKWQNSGGEKSKFGFHANEVLRLVKRLRDVEQLHTLQLLHFHMGSQVANIHDIKVALREAGQFYAELRGLGANIRVVDAGGGLGIDYDGSRSRGECSMNYSIDEYAHNIVRSLAETCARYRLPHPDILTESGRALTAHHAVLITNVIDREIADTGAMSDEAATAQTLLQGSNLIERYHDAQFDLAEARASFLQGKLDLVGLARAERQHNAICHAVKARLQPHNPVHRAMLDELDEKLADKLFCNFSLFQSLPDIWGIDQIFPIMPIHRLLERPARRAVIQDLTCDSDGRIDHYVDSQTIEKTLPVHDFQPGEPYWIGFFLVGAYQEILGDMHNLFGDTHSVNVELTETGYHLTNPAQGEYVSDLLHYVHIDPEQLKAAYRAKLADAGLSSEQQQLFERELLAGLDAYTYLEK